MKKKTGSFDSISLSPRFRIMRGKKIAFGPGNAELLRLVAETGSIGEAARRMDISYMRAWSLIQTINACFKEPVITAARGGNERTDRRGNGSVGGADALRHVQGGGQDDAD